MKFLFSATNALNKWLKADLPTLPVEEGKQKGVNTLVSDAETFSWQVSIIEHGHLSKEKTIIACEANSRFVFFLPVEEPISLHELTQVLQEEWIGALAHTLEKYDLLPRSDIVFLLGSLFEMSAKGEWVKNTDLSISGHITDAGLTVTDTMHHEGQRVLTPKLALDIAAYLNTREKRLNKRKERFIAVERLLEYCQSTLCKSVDSALFENFSFYEKPADYQRNQDDEVASQKEKSTDNTRGFSASNVVNLADYRK